MEKTKENTNKILKYAAIGIAAAGISASTANTADARGFLQIGIGALGFGGYNNCGISPFYNAYQASVNEYQYGTPYVGSAFGFNGLSVGYANRNFGIGLNFGGNYYNTYSAPYTPFYNAYQASVNEYQYGTPYVGVSPYYNAYQAAVNTYQYGTPYVYTQPNTYYNQIPVQQNNGLTLSSTGDSQNSTLPQQTAQYQPYYQGTMVMPAKTVVLQHNVVAGVYRPYQIVDGRPLSSYGQNQKSTIASVNNNDSAPISNKPLYEQYASSIKNSAVVGNSLLRHDTPKNVEQIVTATKTTRLCIILPAGVNRDAYIKEHRSELENELKYGSVNAPMQIKNSAVIEGNKNTASVIAQLPNATINNAAPYTLVRRTDVQNSNAANLSKMAAVEESSAKTVEQPFNWMNVWVVGAAVGTLILLRKKIYRGITGKEE